MATRKGGGAPAGNKNAAGPHNSSRFKSYAVGLGTGALGSFVHGAMSSAHGSKVRSGYHALGGGTGTGLYGAALGYMAGGKPGAIAGAALGGAIGGGLAAGAGSLAGRYVGKHYRKKPK